MGEQGVLDPGGRQLLARLSQGRQPHDDPRSAETALGCADAAKRFCPSLANGNGQAVERCHLATCHSAGRSDAGHPGTAVDEDSAAPTLSLRAAPILHRPHAQAITEDLEQRGIVVGGLDGDVPAIDAKSKRHPPRVR
jgi:hypothetical protein